MSVSVVLKNVCEILGEGPHWDPKTNSLLYVDILNHRLYSYSTITGQNSVKQMGGQVSLIIPRASGGYVVTVDNTLCTLNWENDQLTKLHEVGQDIEGLKFNDGKCDASGRFWAGTMAWPCEAEDLLNYHGKGKSSLYSMECDGSLRKHLSGISLSNGMAWSRDNRTMVYIDTLPRTVYAFDFDIDQGKLSNQRTAIKFPEGTIPTLGYPDGCCMDVQDKLWVACYGPGKVIRFDPETGKELQTVQLPATEITSCCFGGPNHDELYVTSANRAPRDEKDENDPRLGGSLFKVTGLGVCGLPAPEYRG